MHRLKQQSDYGLYPCNYITLTWHPKVIETIPSSNAECVSAWGGIPGRYVEQYQFNQNNFETTMKINKHLL